MKPLFSLTFCLFFGLLCSLAAQPTKPDTRPFTLIKEPQLTVAKYLNDYQALDFSCDKKDSTSRSVRENLFSTALFNDFSQKYNFGLHLEVELKVRKKEVIDIEVLCKGKRYTFWDCNKSPENPPVSPAINDYISPGVYDDSGKFLPLADTSKGIVRCALTSYQYSLTDKWAFFTAEITLAPNKKMVLHVDAQSRFISVMTVFLGELKAEEIYYDNNTGQKLEDREYLFTPPKRETITTFDPNTFQEIEQILVTPQSYIPHGVWKYYSPEGAVIKEERYIDGEKQ